MKVGIPKEASPDERRVALVPASVPVLLKKGVQVLVERGAGEEAGYRDAEYADKGAQLAQSRAELFASADLVLQVRGLGADPEGWVRDAGSVRRGQVLVGIHDALSAPVVMREIAARGATVLSLDLIPRISRAQAMDVLSSMATIAGYKAAIPAASGRRLPACQADCTAWTSTRVNRLLCRPRWYVQSVCPSHTWSHERTSPSVSSCISQRESIRAGSPCK